VVTNSFGGRPEVGLVPLLLKLHKPPVALTSRQLYKMLRSLVRRSIMLDPDLRPVALCHGILPQNHSGHSALHQAYIASPLGRA